MYLVYQCVPDVLHAIECYRVDSDSKVVLVPERLSSCGQRVSRFSAAPLWSLLLPSTPDMSPHYTSMQDKDSGQYPHLEQ
jgi:hypothetical protein